jgi:arabinogalactan endo-1,4-beta-galactosidase
LETTVQTYTTSTLQAFETAGVMPDMVQLGNETTNGMLWPTGELNFSGTQTQQNASWAAFGGLLNAGIAGVRAVQGTGPRIPIALSVDSGDKNGEPQYFYGMITKPVVTGGGSVGGAGVTDFDIEGVDYYPSNYSGTGGTGKTFAFLQSNLTALADTNTNNGTNSNPSKKIMLLENNYPYMGTANSSTEPISNYALNNYPATPNNGGSGSGNPWPATTAGQQQEFTDVRNLMMNLPGGDGEGLLWWYPEAVQVNPYNISNGGDTALFNTAGNNYTALPILSPTTGDNNRDMDRACDYRLEHHWELARGGGSERCRSRGRSACSDYHPANALQQCCGDTRLALLEQCQLLHHQRSRLVDDASFIGLGAGGGAERNAYD